MELEPEKTSEIIQSRIKYCENATIQNETGTVPTVGDGVVRVSGFYNRMPGELLELQDGSFGMAQNLGESNVSAVLLDSDVGAQEGWAVERIGRVVSVPAEEMLLGHVVNAIGQPIDGVDPINNGEYRVVESPAPGIIDRQPVREPTQADIRATNSMIPIGRDQRELTIGGRQTGKITITLDTILNQKGKDVICICVAIGQKHSTVAALVNTLKETDTVGYTVVVAATVSEPSPLQYVTSYAGCATGEYFMNYGQHVLITYDDLSRHAVAYRTISLLIHRSLSCEAYLDDVFYLRSRLLKRAARLSMDKNASPMMALSITRMRMGGVSAYIPTNMISITDGQIFLKIKLFHSGVIPAVNLGISVSCVGGGAQIEATEKVAGTLKLICSQPRELQSFTQFGPDLDAGTKACFTQGERIVEVLKQEKPTPIPVGEQVAIPYAVINHILAPVPAEKIREPEAVLYRLLDRDPGNAAAMEETRQSGAYSAGEEGRSKQTLQCYVEEFLQSEQTGKTWA